MPSSFLANTLAIIWVQLTCRIPHLMHGPYSTRSSDWCWRTYDQYSSMFLPFQVVINGLYSSENNVQASFDSPVKVRHMRSPVRGAIHVLCLNFNNEKYVVALVGFFAGGLFLQYFCYWNFTGVCWDGKPKRNSWVSSTQIKLIKQGNYFSNIFAIGISLECVSLQ